MEETLHRGDSEFNSLTFYGDPRNNEIEITWILAKENLSVGAHPFPHPPPTPKRVACLFIFLKTCQDYNTTGQNSQEEPMFDHVCGLH